MKVPSTAHTSRPWRIHEIAGDFHVEDVWALPTPGGREDLPYLVHQIANGSGCVASMRISSTIGSSRSVS